MYLNELIVFVSWMVTSCSLHQCVKEDAHDCTSIPAPVHLVFVACGDRLQEPMTMVKSALLFGHSPLHVHVFAETHLHEPFENTFQDLLQNVDSVLYVDTDVLFLVPPEMVTAQFAHFNATQVAALAPEGEDASANWYSRFARHPYYEPYGLNSGVMLMNLTRMRGMHWTEQMWPIYEQYTTNLTWGDQDVLNVLFHFQPELLYIYDCTFNFRPDHCMYSPQCKPADVQGVRVLHGSRGYFHKDKQLTFRTIYEIFEKLKVGDDLSTGLLQPLEKALSTVEDISSCKKINSIFLKPLRQNIELFTTNNAKMEL